MAIPPRTMMGLPNSPSFRYKALNPAFQSDPRRILGQQLQQQGLSSAPVRTPLQGLGRLSSALIGAYLQKGAIDRQVAREDERTQQIMGMIPENADPRLKAFAAANPDAFANAVGTSMLQPTSTVFTKDTGGGTIYGTQMTNPLSGQISQNVSGFAAKPKPQATQIITLINPNDPNDFVTGDKNSAEIKTALASNKYQLPSKSGTNVNINQQTETVANKEAAKNGIEQIGALQKEVSSERDLVGRLDISLALLEGDTETGPLTQLITPFKSLGKQLGFLNDEQIKNLSNTEILRAAFAYQIPRMRVPGSGATSDFEARLFKSATANLSNTKEANRIIVSAMRAMNDYNLKRYRLLEKYIKENKSIFGFGEYADKELGSIFKKYDTDEAIDQAYRDGKIKVGDLFYNGAMNEFSIFSQENIPNAT
jgi:hypothetical protein